MSHLRPEAARRVTEGGVRPRRRPPTRQQVADWWEARPPHIMHYDRHEPLCWACGVYSNEHEGLPEPYNGAEWLQRAHLVAHAVDGPPTVDNLVLLCRPCHRQMDGELGLNRNRETALEWVVGWKLRFIAAVLHELDGDAESISAALRPLEPGDTRERLVAAGFNPRSPVAAAAAFRAVAREPEA